MARPTTNLSARIKSLEAAKARLKELKRGSKLTSVPMARFLRVSWPSLKDWCDNIADFDESGAFTRGGMGIEWQFDPRKSIEVLLRHFRDRAEVQANKSRAISKAVGVTMPAAETPSLAETKDLVNLTITVTAAAEKQKRYMLVEQTLAFLDDYNQLVVSSILGVRTKVDPNGQLTPAVRAAVDDHLRFVATQVHAAASKFIKEAGGAGLQQGGTG